MVRDDTRSWLIQQNDLARHGDLPAREDPTRYARPPVGCKSGSETWHLLVHTRARFALPGHEKNDAPDTEVLAHVLGTECLPRNKEVSPAHRPVHRRAAKPRARCLPAFPGDDNDLTGAPPP